MGAQHQGTKATGRGLARRESMRKAFSVLMTFVLVFGNLAGWGAAMPAIAEEIAQAQARQDAIEAVDVAAESWVDSQSAAEEPAFEGVAASEEPAQERVAEDSALAADEPVEEQPAIEPQQPQGQESDHADLEFAEPVADDGDPVDLGDAALSDGSPDATGPTDADQPVDADTAQPADAGLARGAVDTADQPDQSVDDEPVIASAAPLDVQITAVKIIDQDDPIFENGAYTFTAVLVDGPSTAPEAINGTSTADGDVIFESFQITEPGTYVYELRETRPADWYYSSGVFTATLTVAEVDGALVGALEFIDRNGVPIDVPEFSNTALAEAGEASIPISVTQDFADDLYLVRANNGDPWDPIVDRARLEGPAIACFTLSYTVEELVSFVDAGIALYDAESNAYTTYYYVTDDVDAREALLPVRVQIDAGTLECTVTVLDPTETNTDPETIIHEGFMTRANEDLAPDEPASDEVASDEVEAHDAVFDDGQQLEEPAIDEKAPGTDEPAVEDDATIDVQSEGAIGKEVPGTDEPAVDDLFAEDEATMDEQPEGPIDANAESDLDVEGEAAPGETDIIGAQNQPSASQRPDAFIQSVNEAVSDLSETTVRQQDAAIDETLTPEPNTQTTLVARQADGSVEVPAAPSDPAASPADVYPQVAPVIADTDAYHYEAYMDALDGNADGGKDIANTRSGETDVSVAAVWDDSDDQDGLRPGSVTAELLRNGEVVEAAELSKANGWANTWKGLPAFDEDGAALIYTVAEAGLPDDMADEYTCEITGDAADGFTIANAHAPEVVTVAGSKTWADADNVDGLRPASITVRLLADGRPAVDAAGQEVAPLTVAADDEGGWTYSFVNLPKFVPGKQGVEIAYTVEEDAVAGYTTTYDGMDVTNTHLADASIELGATGRLDAVGKPLVDGKFAFTLVAETPGAPLPVDAYGKVVTAASNDAEGNVSFGTATFTQDDLAGAVADENGVRSREFAYTIREIVPAGATQAADGTWSLDGYAYDAHAALVTVVLTDDGSGGLSATVAPNTEGLSTTFVNGYAAAGSAELFAVKTLENADLPSGAFTFELRDEAGTVIDTAANDASGIAAFSAIDYAVDAQGNDCGEHRYTVTEVVPDAAVNAQGVSYASAADEQRAAGGFTLDGVTYDGHSQDVTVTVSDNGDGTLAIDYDGQAAYAGARFTNVYGSEGAIVVHGTKTVANSSRTDLSGFTFALTQVEDGVPLTDGVKMTARTETDGTFAFDAIPFDVADADKTFTYLLSEVDVPAGYVAPADTLVTVKVADRADGTLAVSSTMPEDGYKIVNAYVAATSAKIVAYKEVSGVETTDDLSGFTFTLTEVDEDGQEVDGGERQTVVTGPDGKIAFATIGYSAADLVDADGVPVAEKTFFYKVDESVVPSGYLKDFDAATVAIVVTDNGDGTLEAAVDYGDAATDGALTFTNIYMPGGGEGNTDTDTDNPENPDNPIIQVRKVDGTTREYLLGAKLSLTDSEGALVLEWTSDSTGKIFTSLKAGETYTLHEIEAPQTYRQAKDIKFTVPESGAYAVTMVDHMEGEDAPTSAVPANTNNDNQSTDVPTAAAPSSGGGSSTGSTAPSSEGPTASPTSSDGSSDSVKTADETDLTGAGVAALLGGTAVIAAGAVLFKGRRRENE